MFFAIYSIAACAFLLVFLMILSVRVVPAGRFALVERLGLFERVLGPGGHLVLWPIESLKEVRWSYPGQNGRLQVFRSDMPSSRNAQMDLPPINCLTQDRIQVALTRLSCTA